MRDAIVIVGAGFCGTVLAVNLLRRPGAIPLDITLVERSTAMHRGVAYAKRDHPYLLNVPASRLSADSADPQQFLEYARSRVPGVDAEDFLPRSLYGDYLEDLLLRTERESSQQVRLSRINDEVQDLRRIGARQIEVVLAAGPALRANRVVLAVGNPPPALPEWLDSLRGHAALRADPWDLPRDLREHHSVLIVGNGLTMVDAALALSVDPHRTPSMHTLSRRGLVPQTQTAFKHSAAGGTGQELLSASSSMRALLRAGRRLAREVESTGGDWREAITFVRSLAPQLWRSMPPAERARFVRHVQPHWDVHRHRLPPPLAERLAQLRERGKLRINAGRVHEALVLEDDRVRVSWRGRGNRGGGTLTVDAIVNATGPDYDLQRSREPLLRALRAQGLIVPDALRLGIRTDPSGACIDAGGERIEDLFYVGPMLRADHWEATAVAELRGHAEHLAKQLASSS
jgi:uncharacterized NAD(P)/FAD-binding protein YdhS